jgi:hypothetical protein
MKPVTINTYTYNELSDAAKEKARDWYRRITDDDNFWSECAIDDAKDQGRHLGLDIDNIYYSGFWSQGDGACFEGSWRANRVDPATLAKNTKDPELERICAGLAKIAESYPDASFHVGHRGHYNHENCTVFDHCYGNDDETRDVLLLNYYGPDDEIDEDDDDKSQFARERWANAYPEDEVEELARDYMCWIYSRLEDAYEWHNADEQVVESIIANECTFTEDGKRF